MMLRAMLTGIIRLNNSPSGNPRYQMLFDNGTALLTAPDTAFSYEVMRVANLGKTYDVLVSEESREIRAMEEVTT